MLVGSSSKTGFLQPACLGTDVEGADHSESHANSQSQRPIKTPHHSSGIYQVHKKENKESWQQGQREILAREINIE
jgi:hypothetical protein